MKHKISAFIDSLIQYDYILFGSIFLIFFILIILALVFRKKVSLAISLIVFSFMFLMISPFIAYPKLHTYLFKNELSLTSEKKLQYTKAVVVFGKLKNISARDFELCKITASVTRASENKYKNYIYTFKTIMKMSIIEEDITMGTEIDFKIIVEPFTYTKSYNITLKADCR